MNPMKIFGILWNIWAVIGMLLTFAILGVQIGEAAQWILNFVTGLLGINA